MSKVYALIITTYDETGEDETEMFLFSTASAARDKLNRIIIKKCEDIVNAKAKEIFGEDGSYFVTTPDAGPNFPYDKLYKTIYDNEDFGRWDYEIKEMHVN